MLETLRGLLFINVKGARVAMLSRELRHGRVPIAKPVWGRLGCGMALQPAPMWRLERLAWTAGMTVECKLSDTPTDLAKRPLRLRSGGSVRPTAAGRRRRRIQRILGLVP